MKTYLYVLCGSAGLVLGLIAGYLIFSPSIDSNPFARMNADAKVASCVGINDGATLDIDLFCQMVVPNLSRAECEKTDYVQRLARRTGSQFLKNCSNQK